LAAADAEVIDASDMIVMPGFVDTHYHMWSALGRNFTADGGFGYFPAKNATSRLYSADDFYNSVMLGLVELANAGITTVHNWSHNTRTPAHADAELRAHRDSMLRARYAYGHIDQMPRDQVLDFTDIDRVKRDYFAAGTAFDGLATFGVNLRGLSQSEERTYHQDMTAAMERGLPVAIHASQAPPNCRRRRRLRETRMARPEAAHLPLHPGARHRRRDHGAHQDAVELCHPFGIPPRARRRSTRRAAAHAQGRRGGLVVVRRELDRPAQHVRDHAFHLEHGHPVEGDANRGPACGGFREVIEMATLNGAKALGLGDVTGSLTVGKRADVILIRTNDVNVAPLANIETTSFSPQHRRTSIPC
jgi:Cytosine deaminase and related metal-dependent hydrolases